MLGKRGARNTIYKLLRNSFAKENRKSRRIQRSYDIFIERNAKSTHRFPRVSICESKIVHENEQSQKITPRSKIYDILSTRALYTTIRTIYAIRPRERTEITPYSWQIHRNFNLLIENGPRTSQKTKRTLFNARNAHNLRNSSAREKKTHAVLHDILGKSIDPRKFQSINRKSSTKTSKRGNKKVTLSPHTRKSF